VENFKIFAEQPAARILENTKMYSINLDKINSQLIEIKLSVKHEEKEVLLNKITMKNLERKVGFLEQQLLINQDFDICASTKKPKQSEMEVIRKEDINCNESQTDVFYDKFGKSFDRLMKLEEKISRSSADIDRNQLKVKEWIHKLNKYPTRFKSFKSFYQ